VRVKRANQTIFLNTEPTETVNDLKAKIAAINKVPVENIRLIINNNPLEEAKALSELKVENDAVIHLVYKKEGTNEFEDVQKPDEVKDKGDES